MSAQFIEDSIEDGQMIQISNAGDLFSFKKEKEFNDPFSIGIEDLKKVRGLGTNFKRKAKY